MATAADEKIGCGRCEGSGEHPEFSTKDEPVKCVTCQGSGEVNFYGGVTISSGGVSVEMTAYGHREMDEDTSERALEGVSGDTSPAVLLDLILRAFGGREGGVDDRG